MMTFDQILESVTYRSWALEFVLLGIALAIGTVAYRRFGWRSRPQASYSNPSER
jgi:hypothetical protein